MKLYYVAEKDDNDWDLDATPNYSTRDEAESVKKEMEETSKLLSELKERND